MEGSTVRFDALYVHHGQLPKIQRTEKKGNCADCNHGTHLLWTSPNIDYRLCQGCAKRRGGAYLSTIKNFVISV